MKIVNCNKTTYLPVFFYGSFLEGPLSFFKLINLAFIDKLLGARLESRRNTLLSPRLSLSK